MRLLKTFGVLLILVLLTGLTQIGGLVYLLSMTSHKIVDTKFSKTADRIAVKMLAFFMLYFLTTFLIVPAIARPFGRVPLPLSVTRGLQPGTIWTFLLNRNYVRPSLRETIFQVTDEMSKKYPGSRVNYLDANFPFFDGFPLPPHLSHNDGKKLDLSFPYRDLKTGKITNDLPSFVGYGICENPNPWEINMPEICDQQGYWQYNLLQALISQRNKHRFRFDSQRTRALVTLLVTQNSIDKIFIEPHLKTRLSLTSTKIRFHGCQAVRHDDHIHIQLR